MSDNAVNVLSYYLKRKKHYFENLNINSIGENKLLWKTVYFCFVKKHNSKNSKITLLEKNEVLTNYSKIAKTFNNFFKNEVNILNFEKDANILCGIVN